VRVVQVALFLIAKDFVRLCDGLELGFGLGTDFFGNLVGMMLQCQLRRVNTSCSKRRV
jgi:hypothetical protein